MKAINALHGDPQRGPSPPPAGEGTRKWTEALILDFLVSRTVRNAFQLFISPSVQAGLLQQAQMDLCLSLTPKDRGSSRGKGPEVGVSWITTPMCGQRLLQRWGCR